MTNHGFLPKHLPIIKLLPLLLLILLSLFFCFYNLNKPTLEKWDEYTNYKVVYDTSRSQNFLVLQKDGQSFFEKPPLWYWLTIISTKVLGMNNFALRFVSASSGFLLILLVFYQGWKMFSYRAGIIAGFTLLATRHLFLDHPEIFATHNLRSADLDSLQLLLIMLSSLAFFNITRFTNKKDSWLIKAAIFSGLAFLTKGPFALLPAITFFTFQLIKQKELNWKKILRELLIFNFPLLIIIVPWHLYMTIQFGNNFVSDYFGYHILQRGVIILEGHRENIFFYIKLLFHKDFFFSGKILLLSLIYFVAKYKSQILKDFSLFHCLISSLSVLLIVTLIQTKLSWYILPFYPFAALIVGKTFSDLLNNSRQTIVISLFLVIFILALITQIVLNFYFLMKI